MNVELHRALVLKIKENRDAARGDIFAKARLLYTTANVKKSCKMRQTWKTCQACLGISLADLKSNLTSRTPCHGARDALENPPKEFYCNPNFANTLTVREKLARIHSKKGEREMEGSDSPTLEASITAKPLLWWWFMQTYKVDNETNNKKWERMLRRGDHQIASGMKNGKDVQMVVQRKQRSSAPLTTC